MGGLCRVERPLQSSVEPVRQAVRQLGGWEPAGSWLMPFIKQQIKASDGAGSCR